MVVSCRASRGVPCIKRTNRADLAMSVDGGRPEAADRPSIRREWPQGDVAMLGTVVGF
jgi:hypothetical protein